MRSVRRARCHRRTAAIAALASVSLCAAAQTVPSLTLESDYRLRGVSLSDGKPALRLGIAHDAADGWYAGLGATTVRLDRSRLQLLGYAGIVARAAHELHWELGASATHFDGEARYDYVELLAGVIGQRWNVRLHVSPDYFGRGRGSVYVECNAGMPIEQTALRWPLRLFAHVGALGAEGGDDRVRFDARLGLSMAFDAFDAQLAWVGTRRGTTAFTSAARARRDALVLSASFFF